MNNIGPTSFSAPLHDHHFSFFLSILPDFRKLKRRHKREFKIKVMELLNESLKKDEEQNDNECK